MADDFPLNSAMINPSEVLYLGRVQERLVWNVAKMIRHDPDVILRCHPFVAIETGKIYRPRIAAQGPFTSQVKVSIEVTQRQLAESAVDRLTITATGEV